jgi:DNA repair photolyase
MKAKGEMYTFISHLKNYLSGECQFRCSYCYVGDMKKKFPNVNKKYSGKPMLIESELKENMGSGKTIFVQNNSDLFADSIPKEWIFKILAHCNLYPENTYLFQSKNPERFHEFIALFPPKTILGTTIESNRDFKLTKAPKPTERAFGMRDIKLKKMISIEPICDFDLPVLVGLIKFINPNFVSIGADSKKHGLIEPKKEKIDELIKALEEFTEVKIKSNLGRLA